MPLECDHIRNEFSALLDNELNPEDRELVEEHLSDCSECLRELHGYKVVSDAYRFHHPVKAPEDFEARFHAAIAPIGRRRTFTRQRWVLATAASLAGLISVFVWQTRIQTTPSFELASNRAAETAEAAPPADAATSQARLEQTAPEVGVSLQAASEPAQQPSGLADEAGVADTVAAPEPTAAKQPSMVLGTAKEADGAGGGGFGGGAIPQAAPVTPPQVEETLEAGADTVALKAMPASPARPGAVAAPAANAPEPAELAKEVNDAEAMDRHDAESARRVRQAGAPASPALAAPATPPAAAPPAEPASLRWREQTFTWSDGTWRQSGYADEALTRVAIPSNEWNALLDKYPDINTLCDRNEPVIVKLGEVWYQIAKTPVTGTPR